MKRFAAILVMMLATPALALAWTSPVVKVIDGDTLDVAHNGAVVRVRLFGIDAPERGQPYWRAATKFVRSFVENREVSVEAVRLDERKRRVVAWVSVDGVDLSEALVKAGLAWWYRKYAPEYLYLGGLEAEARAARRGLWAEPDPVPPWECRTQRRRRHR